MNSNLKNNNISIDNSYKKHILQRSAFGIMMGIGDGIPGYSGGTVLSLINFYEELIGKFKGIFKPFSKHIWWRNILWLLPFILFWAISLFAFSILSNFIATGKIFNHQILTKGFPIVLIFTFAFFSIFSIPLFIKSNKPKILEFENKKIKKINVKNSFLCFIGFCLILAIALIIFFVQDGIKLVGSDSSNKQLPYTFPNILLVPLSMFISGFAMLIPGISGSFVLYMFGTYDEIMWTVIHNPITNIGYLFICGVCAILGILVCIFSTNWLIKKFKEEFYSFCFGMICSSFIAILLVGKENYYHITIDIVPLVFCSFIIVSSINLFLFLYIDSKQKKMVDIKKES